MNEQQSPYSHMDDDRSSSPKRRKIRQKYAPKACVSCRRSKLKCSGENPPCQRCAQNGKRCFYSEDQTAAEVLQNLSRPTPTSSKPSFHNSNGDGASQRSFIPRLDAIDGRGSENNPMGMSMESRMARVEAMLAALMQERGLAFTPSVERSDDNTANAFSTERENATGNGFIKSENAFSMPILDPIHPDLQQIGQTTPEQMHVHMGEEPMPTVRVGDRELPFPAPRAYQQYVSSFFGGIYLRYPCVDEVDFNARVQRLMTNGTADNNVHFLASCYIVFACCDLLDIVNVVSGSEGPAGAGWFRLADSIIDKRSLPVHNDIDLVQCYLLQAIYLTYADIPAAAYSAIRTCCNLILQLNIHRQSSWNIRDAERGYWQLCVFWTGYIVDQHVSLSCGRPASLHDCKGIETPLEFRRHVALAQHNPSDVSRMNYSCEYLTYMIRVVDLAAEYFSMTFRVPADARASDTATVLLTQRFAKIEVLDVQFPNFPPQSQSNPIMQSLTELRPKLTMLLLGLRSITDLTYNGGTAHYLGGLAADVFDFIRKLMSNPYIMTAPSHWHHLTSAIAATLLVYAVFLLRPQSTSDVSHIQTTNHVDAFVECTTNLSQLAQGLPYARRVLADCQSVIDIGMAVAERWRSLSAAQRSNNGWSSVMEMIPADVTNVFPYQESSPSLLAFRGTGDDMLAGAARSGSGVLWLF